jgi:hypothetical protein
MKSRSFRELWQEVGGTDCIGVPRSETFVRRNHTAKPDQRRRTALSEGESAMTKHSLNLGETMHTANIRGHCQRAATGKDEGIVQYAGSCALILIFEGSGEDYAGSGILDALLNAGCICSTSDGMISSSPQEESMMKQYLPQPPERTCNCHSEICFNRFD